MRAACNEEKFERARKRNLINNNQLTYARPRRHKHRNHVQRGKHFLDGGRHRFALTYRIIMTITVAIHVETGALRLVAPANVKLFALG